MSATITSKAPTNKALSSKSDYFWKRMWQLRLGVLGVIMILGLVFIAIFAPYLTSYNPYSQNISQRLMPPAFMDSGDMSHPLGTDYVGRDLLTRIIYGTRISILVGLSAVGIQVLIGVLLGLLAGYYGKIIDSVVTFLVNVMMSFPFILLAMSLVAVLGPSLQNIIVALGITGWPIFTRVTRIETMKIRDQEFVLAAKTLGFRVRRIILVHILPNLLPSILVIATVEVARAIIRETLLSFLGLGIQPPTPSWGTMLAEGRNYMLIQWWLATFPGLAIFISALGINLLGDALRDILDPYIRKN